MIVLFSYFHFQKSRENHASSKDDRSSTQRDDQLAANSTAAHNFIEDLDLLLINQDHRQH